MPLVKIKCNQELMWGLEQQIAFDNIKSYLASPPVLVSLQPDKLFLIYLLIEAISIGLVPIQEFEGK
jgi:hypothetical protein